MGTGNQIYKYARPDPFITPTISEESINPQVKVEQQLSVIEQFTASADPPGIFQHDQLRYSGPIIENTMFHISLEYEFRGLGRQSWKAYKTGPADFDIFIAGGSRDRDNPFTNTITLKNYPVKFFPLYVRDMQEKIETLLADSNFPDSIGSLMARIFLNNTTHGTAKWNNQTSLPNSLIVPASENTTGDTETIEPFSNISSTWAFPFGSDHVNSVVPRIGIDFKGQAYVNRGPLAVTTSDQPDKSNFQGNSKLQWPRSVVGKQRVQNDATIEDGFLVDREGSSVEGIDSIHTKGIESDQIDSGRPEHFRKVAEEDATLPGAAGKPDLESGYSFFAHHPHVFQQLRYQPPFIETWEGQTEIRDYVENVFSPTTPNLPWYHSQPVEKVHFSDWGGWLIQGLGGLNDGMFIQAYADGQYSSVGTNCPFSIFFPGTSSNCSCNASNTAYGIWNSSTEGLFWNEQFIENQLVNTGAAKTFGPKTRLILDASVTLGAGTGAGGGAGWFLGIRTSRVATVNLQPFVPIMGETVGATDFGSIFSNSLSVNLMDAMQSHYPAYEKDGTDSILAIGIFVRSDTAATKVVDAVDTPDGPVIPPTDLGCQIGTTAINCSKLYLYEPPYEGPGDPRTPPSLQHGNLQDPPNYNLPILG